MITRNEGMENWGMVPGKKTTMASESGSEMKIESRGDSGKRSKRHKRLNPHSLHKSP